MGPMKLKKGRGRGSSAGKGRGLGSSLPDSDHGDTPHDSPSEAIGTSPKRRKVTGGAASSSGTATALLMEQFKPVEGFCSMCLAKSSEPHATA